MRKCKGNTQNVRYECDKQSEFFRNCQKVISMDNPDNKR